jgi:putative ABC transport system substrate-binding protein
MRRRDFIKATVSAVTAWPLAGRAQQRDRMRRIGVLMALAADDPAGQARFIAFVQALQELGWTDGRNVRIDTRWAAGDAERFRRYAAELVALAPDVILASGGTGVGALLQASRTVPIVFTQTQDPVGAGYVDSLARPGGNTTGFTSMEYGIGGKYLELLKEIAPRIARAAVLRDPTIPQGIGTFGAIQAVAPSLGVELRPIDVRDAGEIERAVAAFARGSNGGLIVTGSSSAFVHRDLIVTLAARHKLPAIYSQRFFVTGGGLISYGADSIDPHRRAAGYVDRILKGEKPADLPVQASDKYELAINLKTASGERLNCAAMTAAHRRLPFGTQIRVCHSGCVMVRINDRGPWVRGRDIDLSPAAARAIGLYKTGHVTTSAGL